MWDNNWRFTLNGMPLYGTDGYGCEWLVYSCAGMLDGADTTLELTQRVYADGAYANMPFRKPRDITLEGVIRAPSRALLLSAWDQLKQTVSLYRQELRMDAGSGIVRCANVMQGGQPLFTLVGEHVAKWSVQLKTTDPYLYGDGTVSGSTGLPSTSGGMEFDYHFEPDSSWQFDEDSTSGLVTLESRGTAPSATIIRVTGSVTNPSIEHVNTGRILSAHVTLGSGHWIEFDMAERNVTMDSEQNSAASLVRNREWSAAVAGSNQWRFSADSGGKDARMTVSFREAYL